MRFPASLLPAVCVLSLWVPAACAQGVSLPYFESFESPSWPGPEWVLAFSAPSLGRIQALPQAPASPDGGNAASFDVSTGGSYSTNELTITVNLAAAPAATLKYWAKETQDETDFEDGVFLNDGISPSWVKVVDHATLTASWIEVSLDLASAATANGLAVTPAFKIRFSQRDNFPVPTDGLQIDGVRIFEPPTGQANSALGLMEINSAVNAAGISASVGVQGPFFASAAPGGPLTFTVQGPPNAPYILAAGPIHANNAIIPGAGSLDIGLLGIGNLSDVAIVLNGTAPGFFNALANTGPSGVSVLGFSIPPLPAGPWTGFQAAVFVGPSLVLTAATEVTVL